MKHVIFNHVVLPAGHAIDRSTPTEVLATAERNCFVIWVRSAEHPTGCPLEITRSEAAARATAKGLATENSHIGLMNLAARRRSILHTQSTTEQPS